MYLVLVWCSLRVCFGFACLIIGLFWNVGWFGVLCLICGFACVWGVVCLLGFGCLIGATWSAVYSYCSLCMHLPDYYFGLLRLVCVGLGFLIVLFGLIGVSGYGVWLG